MTNEELDNARAEEAWVLYNSGEMRDVSAIAARLAREGWMPPTPVDPDLAEAADFYKALCDLNYNGAETFFLNAIKRGRALAAAEAKPGMVWVKHDGSRQSPVPGALVTVSLGHSHYQTDQSFMIDWWLVSHYAIITQPEDVA